MMCFTLERSLNRARSKDQPMEVMQQKLFSINILCLMNDFVRQQNFNFVRKEILINFILKTFAKILFLGHLYSLGHIT